MAGDSNNPRIALVRAAQYEPPTYAFAPKHIMHMQQDAASIHFDDGGLGDSVVMRNDALVVSASLSNFGVKKYRWIVGA